MSNAPKSLFRRFCAALCVSLVFVFVGASTASLLNRIQHEAETTAPHEHMILSDVSYLADHDDRLHAGGHHVEDVAETAADSQEIGSGADVHGLVGSHHDSSVSGHFGHHHNHHGETGGNMIVLGSGTTSAQIWQAQGKGLVRERVHTSVQYSLPERPPRSPEIRA